MLALTGPHLPQRRTLSCWPRAGVRYRSLPSLAGEPERLAFLSEWYTHRAGDVRPGVPCQALIGPLGFSEAVMKWLQREIQ
jgi:hypothetical protein